MGASKFRGSPKELLKAIDDHTLVFAAFGGKCSTLPSNSSVRMLDNSVLDDCAHCCRANGNSLELVAYSNGEEFTRNANSVLEPCQEPLIWQI